MEKSYVGQSIGVSYFSHRNEGEKGVRGQKRNKKGIPEQMEEVKRAMALRCPDLKAWKFSSYFYLNFVENL